MVVAGTGGVKKGVDPSIQICMASTTVYGVREVYLPRKSRRPRISGADHDYGTRTGHSP